MKVLVTGSNGFLGSALVKRLLETGVKEIRCFVREGSNRARLDLLKERFPSAQIEYYTGTLNSHEDPLGAVKGVDIVYHLAASLGGAPADMFLNTVVASKNLLEAIVTENPTIPLVHISSFSVYGVAHLPKGYTITEETPLENHPERRDPYAFVKWYQEKLLLEYQQRHGFPLIILRPGVIYGPHGSALSGRVGLQLGSIFLHLGGSNILPLSYVENCADAIITAAEHPVSGVSIYNVHDDDLPSSRSYLRAYQREVKRLHPLPIPYPLLQLISKGVEWYHGYSKGQLPAIFTPYKSANLWKGNRFDNSKIKSIGWRQRIPTAEGMRRTFDYFSAIEKESSA